MAADTMLHLIAYDVSKDKTRTKLHKLLCRYGEWTQFSLFECFLTAKQAVKLIAEIKAIISQDQGHVRIYVLSRDDVKRTVTIGGALPTEDQIYVV